MRIVADSIERRINAVGYCWNIYFMILNVIERNVIGRQIDFRTYARIGPVLGMVGSGPWQAAHNNPGRFDHSELDGTFTPVRRVAWMVDVPALSMAVKVVVVPEAGLTWPPPVTRQLTDSAGATLMTTSSPTPILVRARFVGDVATVSELSVHGVQGFGHGAFPRAFAHAPGPAPGRLGLFFSRLSLFFTGGAMASIPLQVGQSLAQAGLHPHVQPLDPPGRVGLARIIQRPGDPGEDWVVVEAMAEDE